MNKYIVTITETSKMNVEVEAENLDEAEAKVNDAWYRGDYVLDADNFVEVDFEAEEKRPEKIKVVLLEPGKLARVEEIGTSLEDLQAVVGGYIEAVYPFDEEVCIVCNEEGKLQGLELNRGIYDENKNLTDIIAGKAFICDCSGEDFGSLSDEQQKKYMNQFKCPEKFFKIGNDIHGVKFNPMEHEKER